MVNTVKGINIPGWRTVGWLFNVSAYMPITTNVINQTNIFGSRSTMEISADDLFLITVRLYTRLTS